MVLQNKYKARASRRYQAKKGIAPAANAKHGSKTVEASAIASDVEGHRTESDQETSNDEATFARRTKLASNSWRYDEDDNDDENDEPEPEVDLTNLRSKVQALDLHAATQAQKPASASSDEEEGDFDSRAAQKQALDQVDWEEMRREKEAAEAAQALKDRFERMPPPPRSAASWRHNSAASRSRQRGPESGSTPSALGPQENRGSAPSKNRVQVRYEPRATPAAVGSAAQDIDEFLASLNDDDPLVAPASAPASGLSTVSTASSSNKLQDYLDDLLG